VAYCAWSGGRRGAAIARFDASKWTHLTARLCCGRTGQRAHQLSVVIDCGVNGDDSAAAAAARWLCAIFHDDDDDNDDYTAGCTLAWPAPFHYSYRRRLALLRLHWIKFNFALTNRHTPTPPHLLHAKHWAGIFLKTKLSTTSRHCYWWKKCLSDNWNEG